MLNKGPATASNATTELQIPPGGVYVGSSKNSTAPGQLYSIGFVTRNLGRFPAAGVEIRVASGATINSASTEKGTVSFEPNLVIGVIGTLNPDEIAIVTLHVTTDAGFRLTDPYTAVVTTTTDDYQPANNVRSEEIPITPPKLLVVPPGPMDPPDAFVTQWRDVPGLVLEKAFTLGTFSPWTLVPESQIQTVPPNRRHVTTRDGQSRFFRTRRRGPANPICTLHQVAMVGDDFVYLHSGWGQAELTFNGSAELQYFNLTVNDSWVAQNVPVLSRMGADVAQTIHFKIPLGVFGIPLVQVNAGQSLTPEPVVTKPPFDIGVSVGLFAEKLFSGLQDQGLEYSTPENLVGGTVVRHTVSLPSFPNREQGRNECVPAAILNSLNFLNQHHSLSIDPAELTMEKMRAAVDWNFDGAPVDDVNNITWVRNKQRYMAAKEFPITTTVTKDPQQAMNALSNRCDVEISMTGHAAAVVGMTDLGNNRYSLDLAHDIRQGEDGGTIVETVILDMNQQKLEFSSMFGSNWTPYMLAFVIECPSP